MPTPSTVRRSVVLAVLSVVLTGLGLVVTQAPALACTCSDRTVRALAETADVIVQGTVSDVAREPSGPAPGSRPRNARLTYTVEVDRAWQGAVPRRTVAITSSSNTERCGLGSVPAGRDYVFFATARGSALSTNRCTGTAVATDGLVAEVSAALGPGRAVGVTPVEPEPPVPEPVDDSPPPDFGRTAAPGAALALVGLLGLLVVRRRSR